METFLIDVPMPSMGATVNELTVVNLKTQSGVHVTKGQKIAELESDKSIFDFESPCEGTIKAVYAAAGDVRPSGSIFLQIETSDASLQHLKNKAGEASSPSVAPAALKTAQWTPRATKLAQEAGLDPSTLVDVEATGPGGRVSGDDVTRYIEQHRK